MRIRFVSRLRARCRACGFTLVELMVTLAVAAILAMIAVPSFQRLILSNRLNTSANALVNAVNLARLDAIKLNSTTQFCSNNATSNGDAPLSTACGTAAGAVVSLPQSATSASLIQTAPPGITAPVQIASGGVTGIRFSGQGFGYKANGGSTSSPYTGTVATICTSPSRLPGSNQRIIKMTAGSILATASSSGACP